jgi:hypothetical protein
MLELVAGLVVLVLIGPLVLIGAGGLLLLVAALSRGSPRRNREMFLCPVTKRVVTADFLTPEGAAHPAEVAWCTAFPDPDRITCKKSCREFAEVSWGLSRGVFPRWALTAGGLVTWRNPGA